MPIEISHVHPELQSFARHTPRFDFSRKNLWLWRFAGQFLLNRGKPFGVSIENVTVASRHDNNPVPVRLYRPTSQPQPTPALLWLHGGGYILGHPAQDDAVCAEYAREAGILVASVDYRYAPENPFPTGLEDAYSVLLWLGAQANRLGIKATHLAIGGNSAGGGLAAALGQLAHDRQEISPRFQLLVYPMLDDRTVLRTEPDHRDYIGWSAASNRFGWESYLGQACGAHSLPEYAVPARRADLSCLPPAWIGVGTLDLFHDEDVAYARALQQCGVDCSLQVIPGAFHGFDVAGAGLSLTRAFRQSQIQALKKYLCE